MKKKVPFTAAHAKAHFSDRVRQALAGEDVIIAKDSRPPLKHVPPKTASQPRQVGSAREGRAAPDFEDGR
jgi:antitoxin (DNA-binding transcriptional repressor) of toxin-antitoxin stability system